MKVRREKMLDIFVVDSFQTEVGNFCSEKCFFLNDVM